MAKLYEKLLKSNVQMFLIFAATIVIVTALMMRVKAKVDVPEIGVSFEVR